MAYLGTPPRSRVLSSADIDPGSVSLDDISFTDQPASMNISGNIDKHTMRLADQVVVNGDLDVTDNLILSKISDDGNAIILTNDSSTRTIEGAGGSLEASTLTQTPNASLTGMTGTVGSGVTIGSDVTFPAGHVVQTSTVNKASTNTSVGTGTVGWTSTVVTHSITPKYSNSAIIVHANFVGSIQDANGDSGYNFRWLRSASGISDSYPAGMNIAENQTGTDAHSIYMNPTSPAVLVRTHQHTLMDENVTVADTPVTYTLQVHTYNVEQYAKFGSNNWTNYQWSIFLQEIKR
jgi:hypothetical protein